MKIDWRRFYALVKAPPKVTPIGSRLGGYQASRALRPRRTHMHDLFSMSAKEIGVDRSWTWQDEMSAAKGGASWREQSRRRRYGK